MDSCVDFTHFSEYHYRNRVLCSFFFIVVGFFAGDPGELIKVGVKTDHGLYSFMPHAGDGQNVGKIKRGGLIQMKCVSIDLLLRGFLSNS